MCAVSGVLRSWTAVSEPWHHDVQRDNVRRDHLHLVEAVLAVDRGVHVEPLKGEVHRDKLTDHLVVVHDEHPPQTLRHAGEATVFGNAMRRETGLSQPMRPDWYPFGVIKPP
jgi:hypothetical protein